MTTRVLLIATEWRPSKGGVSSFNMELCLALHRTGHEVHCVVPRATDEEVAEAAAAGVKLHSAAAHGVADGAPFDLGFVPNVVVGHDRWSGPQAARWRQRFPEARLAILLHVHPGQIDGLKNDASIAARAARIAEGKHRIAHADASFGVGELLADWWRTEVPGFDIHTFVPGLPCTLPAVPRVDPTHPRVLLIGRAEDAKLKGVHLTARAMREVVDGGFRDAELVVRGVTPGTDVAFEASVRKNYPTPRRFQSRPFDPSRSAIAGDLASSSLVLQPSLEEGFGLVTLEAVALETPVLVSSRSGVARVIERVDAANAPFFVVESGDERAWTEAIERVLTDVPAATSAVRTLKSAIAANYTWDSAASELVSRTLAAARPRIDVGPTPPLDQCRTASRALGEYPRKTDGEWIERREQDAVRSWLATPLPDHENGVLLLVGAPGTGKSALLASIVQDAHTKRVPVLGIKADLLPAEIDSPEALRAHLGLEKPIGEMLEEMAAVYGSALLVIDQLDALCEVVDSRTSRLETLIRLMRRASELENVRVVSSVRPFELRHEARLRAMHSSSREVSLGLLTVEDLRTVLPDEVLVPDVVDSSLLTPHALDLMVELSRGQGAGFQFPSSLGDLRARFWRAGVADTEEREAAALAVADAMGRSGALWVRAPSSAAANAVQHLVDFGLLRMSPDGARVGFRHQTLFDFARARGLIRGECLEAFIAKNERSLEVRPLVRSSLLHLRTVDRDAYHALADALFGARSLHVRLLVVDTLLEADTPTPREKRLFLRAVNDAATRGRALNGVARRDGWLTALSGLISAWMSDCPEQSTLLAAGYLRIDPSAALHALERNWLGTGAGDARIVRVLSWATQLGAEADALLAKLVPHLVRTSHFEMWAIGQAIARDDPRRAARLCVSCIAEEGRALQLGESVARDLRAFDELLELKVDPGFLLDLLEPVVAEFLCRTDYPLSTYNFRESLEQTYEQLLQRLAKVAPEATLRRASDAHGDTALLPVYLRVLGNMHGHVSERVAWVLNEGSRLSVDPESVHFIDAVSEQLGPQDVRLLDAAIDAVVRYPSLGPEEPVSCRRDRDKENRRYRMCLRARLPQAMREESRICFDEAETHQLPGGPFEPQSEPRVGMVVSPVSKEQLSRATDLNVLKALDKERELFTFDERDLPIGGANEVISELRKLAQEQPERVAGLVEQMRDQGDKHRARRLLMPIAEHHPDHASVEQLAISLFANESSSIEEDDECAWALGTLAKRAGLGAASITAIVARLESVDRRTPPEEAGSAETEDDSGRRELALFDFRSGGIVPGGQYRWLRSLANHFFRSGTPDPETWARAVRAALRADSERGRWTFALTEWYQFWGWLGGPQSFELLNEIAAIAFSPGICRAITRVYAWHRSSVEPRALQAWIERLECAEQWTSAGELAVLIATDKAEPYWADGVLETWRTSARASDFSTGVIGAVGKLLAEGGRRGKVSTLAVGWMAVMRMADLDLLFADTLDSEAWRPDAASARILEALRPRICEVDAEGLRLLVFLLERFIDSKPELVLALTEGILDRALALEGGTANVIISECLALSISLRLALPHESDRTHELFERALAADAPAAIEALDAVDGRTSALVLRPLYRRPRPRVRRARRRRPYF